MAAKETAEKEPFRDLTKELLQVKVFSPFRIFYEGRAKSVSAVNATGPFDILPGHISFFSLLINGDVVVDTGKEAVSVPISHGLVHLRHNQATVFVFGLTGYDEDGEEEESIEG